MTDDELDTNADHALCDVLGQNGELVSKWVAVVEVIDGQGQRWLRTLSSPQSATWDSIGMLTQAVTQEKATAVPGYPS